MTEKQKNTIAILPQEKFNIRQAMLKSGYAESTSRSGQQYERIHKHLLDYYNPDQLKADIQATRDKAMAKDDLTAVIRLLELQSRITGLIKHDSTINQTNIIGDDHIKALKDRLHTTQHTDTQQHTT